MAVEVGQVLDGKYRIVRLLGAGGMGAVYEATHLLIDRRVAVKELHADAAAADHAITRFEREARAAGRIGSDHILQIFDVGVLPDGSRYMVSEFLDGETLDSRLRRVGRLTPAELYPITQQLLTGLDAAHQALVLHRDLKPDNIFLVRQKAGVADFVKIIDFGIAKFQLGVNQEDALRMTKTGMVVGTPYYLSPEQARGTGEADARSDLYAVGVILYECITGQVPFSAQNFNELIFKIVLERPKAPADVVPGVDQRLSDLILKAMARDPADRFQSAQEMMAALSAWAASEGSANVNWGHRSSPPTSSQTLLSAQAPFGRHPSGNPPPFAAFRAPSPPTPASFGATRDPMLATVSLPLRQSSLLFLLLGGLGLMLLGAGVLVFRYVHNAEPADAASAVQPPASSVVEARPTAAPPVAPTIEPSDLELPGGPPTPALLPPLDSEPPRAQQSSNLGAAPRPQRQTAPAAQARAASAPAAPAPAAPAPEAPAVPAPAAPAGPAPAESPPKDRGNWGY